MTFQNCFDSFQKYASRKIQVLHLLSILLKTFKDKTQGAAQMGTGGGGVTVFALHWINLQNTNPSNLLTSQLFVEDAHMIFFPQNLVYENKLKTFGYHNIFLKRCFGTPGKKNMWNTSFLTYEVLGIEKG